MKALDRDKDTGCDLDGCDVELRSGAEKATIEVDRRTELGVRSVLFRRIFCEYCYTDFFLRGAEEQRVQQVLSCLVADRAAARRRILIGDTPDPIP